LLCALQWEILFRKQRETRKGAGVARLEGERTNKRFAIRPRTSDEDTRMHASVAERLAAIHYERCGLWPKIRRFLFGNCLARLLGLKP
jgi:hypothetical protein